MKAWILAMAIAAPAPALAQSWESYSYADQGVAFAMPGKPTVTTSTYPTGGKALPSVVYLLSQPDVVLRLIVSDFTSAPAASKDAIINQAVKALSADRQVTVDEMARIDREYGRSLALTGKDGSRALISVFYVGDRLYELEGRALPPNALNATGKVIRFQQSLEFIGTGAEAFRPENRPLGQGPGPGGPGRAPPPQAFEDCRGKTAGAAVQHRIPPGQRVAATCVQTPQGLAARPDVPPSGGPGQGPPPRG